MAQRLVEALCGTLSAKNVRLVDRQGSREMQGISDLDLSIKYGAISARDVKVVVVDHEDKLVAVWKSQPSVHDVLRVVATLGA